VIGRLWFAVALLIVMVSFSFKVLYYRGAPDALMKVGQKRLNEFFQDHRFVLAGTVDLAPEPRSLTFTTFIGPSCDKAIRAAALSSDLSADQMAAELLNPGERLFFVYRGRVAWGAPVFASVFDRFFLRGEEVGLGRLFKFSPYVGVIEPVDCHLEESLPWQELLTRVNSVHG
jgi:hypothetical protein